MKSFTFHLTSKYGSKYVRVPRGFVTDFATIPKFLWFLPYWAKFNKSPVIHDWLYSTRSIKHRRLPISAVLVNRKEADDMFLEAMLVNWRKRKSRYIVAYLEYWTVRIVGGFKWKN